MSSASLISTSPLPLPSPTPSIRPSKLELLRLLREQREREQLGAQALSAQSTPSASSVPSVSNPNSLLPTDTPEASQEAKINMGAILGGLAGGVLLLAIILVAIIVPLQRRRSLRKAVAGVPVKAVNGRRRINLDLPWSFGGGGEGGKDEERGGGGQDEKDQAGSSEGRRTYPTVRSGAGTHKTTGSEVPLLGGNGGGSGGNTPTRSAFGENGTSRPRLDHPQEARHPTQSSTHLYEDLPLSSPTELDGTRTSRKNETLQKQQPVKHEDLWFYYRTNSTAAPPISNNGTVNSGAGLASAGAGVDGEEFNPYTPFNGTPSPLDSSYRDIARPSITLTALGRPVPAAAPSSPKKATRDLPLPDTSPFIDVDLNDMTRPNAAGVGTVNSANFGTGKSSVDIYTCIDNPFMAPFERNQASAANASAKGEVAAFAPAQGGGSWFSYHSSSVRSGPHSRPAPLPPTFLPSITTSPTELTNPNRMPSPDSSEPDSASVYSQMSLSRSGTAMSVNGSVIRYGSVRAQAAENGGSGFMPVVHEAKEDTPTKPSFPRDASAAEGPTTSITPATPSESVEDDDPTPKATPASSANARVSLARMDTLAIGNLIKSRAKRVAMERSPSDVERIEREGSMGESDGGSGIRNDVAAIHQGTKELEKTAAGSSKPEEEPVVRGRGVRREEVEGAADYGAIPRAPIKRTSSDQAIARSRSQSRGRLVPKASLQRMRGGSSDNEGTGGSEEGVSFAAKPPIGRSPSKYRPKGLQQRLVEKGLLNLGGAKVSRSRSASREGKERVRPRTTSVPTSPIDLRAKDVEVKVVVGQGEGEGSSSAESTPSPSPAKSKGKNKNKKNLLIRKPPPSDIGSDLLSPPQDQTKAAERVQSFAANPLTGAFGLGQPPGIRSPATPTFQYAFAELERAKGFFPKVEGLNVSTSGKKKGGK